MEGTTVGGYRHVIVCDIPVCLRIPIYHHLSYIGGMAIQCIIYVYMDGESCIVVYVGS